MVFTVYQKIHILVQTASIAIALLLCISCGNISIVPTAPKTHDNSALAKIETDIAEALSNAETDVDFSFAVEREDGRRFVFNKGLSSMNTQYESASTSKMVTATIILSLVDRGLLSLDSKPQDLIPAVYWPINSSDTLYGISLRSLLCFTSGLVTTPLFSADYGPLDSPVGTMQNTVRLIALSNANNGEIPFTKFWYSSTHLQVAGLMAVSACSSLGFTSWKQIFNDFKTRTGLFPDAKYDLPSETNPRLAGGMHWTGNEYLNFLRAYYFRMILQPSTHIAAISDQLTNGITTPYAGSPIKVALSQDWHYGFGIWLECTNTVFNGDMQGYSSPGAYGAYPFLNTTHKFFGVIARQGAPVTFEKGYLLYQSIMPLVIQWANTK